MIEIESPSGFNKHTRTWRIRKLKLSQVVPGPFWNPRRDRTEPCFSLSVAEKSLEVVTEVVGWYTRLLERGRTGLSSAVALRCELYCCFCHFHSLAEG